MKTTAAAIQDTRLVMLPGPLLQQIGSLCCIAPAPRDLGAVAHVDLVITVEPWVNLGDCVDVDDVRAVHTRELCRIEPRFERFERRAQRMVSARGMDRDAVAVGFQTRDLARGHEEGPAVVRDE